MTRCVADAALMLTVMSGYDARAWAALPTEVADYRVGLEGGVRGLRVAFSETLGYARVDPEVAELVRVAVAELERLGAAVEEADPGEPDPVGIFDRHWFMPAAWTLSKMTPPQRALVDPGLRAVAEQGARWSAFDYLQAMSDRANYGVAMSLFLDRYDLLVTPTLPIPAFPAGRLVADPATQTRWTDWTPFTYPFNLTQQPAASLPVGLTRAGLPVGLQIVAGKHRDALVLRAARALEDAFAFRPPPMAGS
jgi:aspartyl-tRNA(Asn)/glutamyl-tRNA(Gln) amidotransferase subunit A